MHLSSAGAALLYVAHLVDQQTIRIVAAQRLLPRWDLATHLNHGWQDYHLLVTGQIHRLLWDLWLQGYWPPVLSIYQVPFYLFVGGRLESGLRSALAAFVLTGVLGCVLMWRQWKDAAAAAGGTVCCAADVVAVSAGVRLGDDDGNRGRRGHSSWCCLTYRCVSPNRERSAARAFAVSLTLLFFTKYNYFFLLVVPL